MLHMYRMKCLTCLRKWSTTRHERDCPFCGSDVIATVGVKKK